MARVLVIDDDEVSLDLMRRALQLDGHELASATNGVQGLALLKEFRPELVICDVVMPRLGGYAVLETMRADPQFSQVPVLLFSALMNDETRALALRRGATEVLARPFELAQLRGAIRRCLKLEGQ